MQKQQRRYSIMIALIGVVLSLIFIKKFYLFTPQLFPEALFLEFTAPAILPEWRETAVFLGQLAVVVSVLLSMSLIFIADKYVKKVTLGAIFLPVLICSSFYFIHKEYNYKYHPYLFGYMTYDGKHISNPHRYFKVIDKYGFKAEAYRPFNTLDEAIQGLEYAKNREDGLYNFIFPDLEKFGYEEVFKIYDDEYFQLYFLNKMLQDFYIKNYYLFEDNIDKIKSYMSYISNKDVLKLYGALYNSYEQVKKEKGNVTFSNFEPQVDALLKSFSIK